MQIREAIDDLSGIRVIDYATIQNELGGPDDFAARMATLLEE